MGNEQAKLPRLLRSEIVGGEADAVGLQIECLLVAEFAGALRPTRENMLLEPRHRALRYFAQPALSLGTGGGADLRNEGIVDLARDLVCRQFFEYLEILGLEILDGGLVDERVFLFEKAIEPGEGVDAEILSVLVRALGYVEAEVVGDAEHVVDPFRLSVDVDHAVERKYAILVGVRDEEGARRDERGDHGVSPSGRR